VLDLNPTGPLTINRKNTAVLGTLRCSDGDRACDRDGAVDGQCTFGIAVCLGNEDPRFPKCAAAPVTSFEVMAPMADRGTDMDRENAAALAQAAGATTGCGSLVEVHVPAPTGGAKITKRKLKMRGRATDGRIDTDKLVLTCGR
jgi:hypothetical protein